jgi:hypothetical protein
VVRAGVEGDQTEMLAAITNGGDAFLAFSVMIIVLFVLLLITVDK